MDDSISRQAVFDAVTKYCMVYDLRDLLADIEMIPSEGKHGEWLAYPPDEPFGEWTGWKCSLCGNVTYEQNFDFCPYCGARMDEVEE